MEGFIYRPDVITTAEETQLLQELEAVPTAPLYMRGQLTKRQIAGFGLDYRPSTHQLAAAPPISCVLNRRS